MTMIEGLKPLYNRLLRPALRLFVVAGLHPNHLTITGLLVFGAVGWFSAQGHWVIAGILAVGGSLLDGWDGLLARETGQESRFGAILDSSLDRLTEIAWLAGLLYYYSIHAQQGRMGVYASVAALSGSFMVSYVKARCEGAGVECRGGMMQRPERIILLNVCMFLGPVIMSWGLVLLAALTYGTMIQRLFIARKACDKSR